jgi:hypothetical protein
LGPDHPDTLLSSHQLAWELIDDGKFHQALVLETHVVEGRTRFFGPDSPLTLQARSSVAHFTGYARDPATAADMARLVASDRERILGAQHPHTFASRFSVTRWTAESGRKQAAIQLLNSLLSDWQRAIDTPNLTDLAPEFLRRVTDSNPSQSRYAVRERSATHRICERLLGPDHTLTVEIQRLIAGKPSPE